MRLCVVCILSILLATAYRLPAPIQEESPSPAPEHQAKPKKASSKSKAGEVEHRTKSETKSKPAPALQGPMRFAGTWVGTMPEVPWGNVATELIIDQTGTTMQWQESGTQKGTSPAQINGDTIQANFQVGVPETWSLTLSGDGTTARVRLQAFMNDQTAVFHRVAGGANTLKQIR